MTESKKMPVEEHGEGAEPAEKNTEEAPVPVLESAEETEQITSELAGAESEDREAASETEEGQSENGEAASETEEGQSENGETASETEEGQSENGETAPETEEAESENGEAESKAEEAVFETGGEGDAQQEEGPEEEVERPEGAAWYVLHSYSGYENKVKKNLLQRIESMDMGNLIFNVVVPTEEEVEIKDGRRRTYKKRVFPGYILVEMLLTEQSWYVVRNTPGVTGFVGSGSSPTPLRDEEVNKIIKRMEVKTPKIKVGFREGQTVRITTGPFADFMGTVDELFLNRGKVRVLVSMFGRETPVELDFLQVAKI